GRVIRIYSAGSSRYPAPVRSAGVVAAAMLLVVGACSSGSGGRHGVGPATTSSARLAPTVPATTAAPATEPPPAGGTSGPDIATLLAGNVRLLDSAQADNGFRVLLDSAAGDLSVVLFGIPAPNRTIFVCPATDLDHRAPAPSCTAPAEGAPVRLPHAPAYQGVEVVQVGPTGTGPTANSYSVTNIAITFTPASRDVRVRLPPLRSGPTAGQASFRMAPAGDGNRVYRATASWIPVTGDTGRAELTLSTGTSVSAQSDGGPGVTVTASLPSSPDPTLRLRNTGPSTIAGLTITASFP
ncbi:MAG: hypothetical protein LC792_25055, partial [Actinobacteria bacterium]|nr:hypothetical protein [Actinomycetota bacterium]